jgi:hypothetical protein
MPEKKHPKNNNELTDEQIVKGYIDLSQQVYKQFQNHRDLQWRVHVTLWTFLAFIAYLSASTGKLHLGYFAAIIFLTIPIHIIWLLKTHRGEVLDLKLSRRYRNEAEMILRSSKSTDNLSSNKYKSFEEEERSEMIPWIERVFKHYIWWIIVDVGMTVLLSMGDYWLLMRK